LKSFHNEQIGKSEISDVVHAMKISKNVDEYTVAERLQSDV
jgi:hypothetical protein